MYMLGSPAIKTATIRFENGSTLTIEARNQSDKNVYVSKVTLNGRELNRDFLTYQDITGGGRLAFEMSDRPGRR
jgi:putative alpha-1,2-mannosidase